MISVTSCCCGCSLRTGTLIMLWTGTVLSAFIIAGGITGNGFKRGIPFLLLNVLPNAIPLVVHIIGIYGVKKEIPKYLIPYLVFQLFCMMFIVMFIYALRIGGVILAQSFMNEEVIRELKLKTYPEQKIIIELAILGTEMSCVFCLFLLPYMFIVTLSFYNKLKAKSD